MTEEQIRAYVRDVVEAMDIGDLIEYANEQLTQYYMQDPALCAEEAKEFYNQ